MLGIWGTRRVVLFLAAMGVALLIASGLAVAATLNGTSGDDNIVGTEDIDTINGFGGNDTVAGKGGNDSIVGGAGDDTLFADDNYLLSEAQAVDGTVVSGGSGSSKNSVKGELGNDTIVGGNGPDELRGGDGADTLVEGADQDQSFDTFSADNGDDVIDAASDPASKDIVDCGGGIDEAKVDPLDDISGSCENVEVIDPNAVTVQFVKGFSCIVPRFGETDPSCGGLISPFNNQYLTVKLNTSGGKRVDFRAWRSEAGPDFRVGSTAYLYPDYFQTVWRNTTGRQQSVYFKASSPAVVKVQATGNYTTTY